MLRFGRNNIEICNHMSSYQYEKVDYVFMKSKPA